MFQLWFRIRFFLGNTNTRMVLNSSNIILYIFVKRRNWEVLVFQASLVCTKWGHECYITPGKTYLDALWCYFHPLYQTSDETIFCTVVNSFMYRVQSFKTHAPHIVLCGTRFFLKGLYFYMTMPHIICLKHNKRSKVQNEITEKESKKKNIFCRKCNINFNQYTER